MLSYKRAKQYKEIFDLMASTDDESAAEYEEAIQNMVISDVEAVLRKKGESL